MSLSALLYFAANPGVSDDDVFARLTRGIRVKKPGSPGSDESIHAGTGALPRKAASKQAHLCAHKTREAQY